MSGEITVVRQNLEKMRPQFRAALPAQVPVERFERVVLTALQGNPSLMNCSRQSLWGACMRAAQDGLLPDGREGAIVPFKGQAQWLPMVGGLLKKIRNSGELKTLTARVVYDGDLFRHWIDEDGEHLRHEPSYDADRERVRFVYALAKTRDDGVYVEVMTVADVEKVRAASRAARNGPWVDWWDEMAKKTAIRRLAKRLPMSTDLDDLIRREDRLFDLEPAASSEGGEAAQRRPALDAFAAPAIEDHSTDDDTVTDDASPGAEDGAEVALPEDAAPEEIAGDDAPGEDAVALAEEVNAKLGSGETEKAVSFAWHEVLKERVFALPDEADRADIKALAEVHFQRARGEVEGKPLWWAIENRLGAVRDRNGQNAGKAA